jgi:hypothetical protein
MVTFEQIFFDGAGAPADVDRAVAAARVVMSLNADPRKLGQTSLLPRRVENAAEDLVARDFGAAFARQVGSAPVGQWSGPIASSFGTHLVRVIARTPSVLPPLEAVRAQVAREWENQRRVSSRNASYEKLRANYKISIEAKTPMAVAAR